MLMLRLIEFIKKRGFHAIYISTIIGLSILLYIALRNPPAELSKRPESFPDKLIDGLDKIANATATAPNDLTANSVTFLYHWQGLIGGFLAVLVGIITIFITASSVKAQIDSDDLRRREDISLKAKAYQLSLRPLARYISDSAQSNIDTLKIGIKNAENIYIFHPYMQMRDATKNTCLPIEEKITPKWEEITISGNVTLNNFLVISEQIILFEAERRRIINDTKEFYGNKADANIDYAPYLNDILLILQNIKALADEVAEYPV